MTPEQFVYWLNGYSELSGECPTAEAWKSIQEHLHLVLKKVTPTVEKKAVSIGDFIPSQKSPGVAPLPYIPPYQFPTQPFYDKFWLTDKNTTLMC